MHNKDVGDCTSFPTVGPSNCRAKEKNTIHPRQTIYRYLCSDNGEEPYMRTEAIYTTVAFVTISFWQC